MQTRDSRKSPTGTGFTRARARRSSMSHRVFGATSRWSAACGGRARVRIVAVMLLAAAVGTNVRVETDGPDELAAMTAIVSLLNDGLERQL